MKSLGDAIDLRNTLIARLEEANPDCATKNREPLLTFVVAGGGFAGAETVGSIKDFLHDALPYYPNLKPEMIKTVLVHPGDFVLPELGEGLGRYAWTRQGKRPYGSGRISGLWALGDCAMVPDSTGGFCPPTAQHAARGGKVLASNIIAGTRREPLRAFRFKTLCLLASIGQRTGVARILGVNFSGFLAIARQGRSPCSRLLAGDGIFLGLQV
jgi:NADH dehydrogenase